MNSNQQSAIGNQQSAISNRRSAIGDRQSGSGRNCGIETRAASEKLRTLHAKTLDSRTFSHGFRSAAITAEVRMVNSFRDLQVWQKAMDLADTIYTMTAAFPREEMFGLAAQLRRAAVSIPSNLAEGRAIGGGRFLHHIRICLGSEAELETQIELSVRRCFVSRERARGALEAAAEVARMLHGLHAALKARQARTRQQV